MDTCLLRPETLGSANAREGPRLDPQKVDMALLLTHRVASSVVVVVVVVVGAHLDCRTRTTARLPCKVSRLFVHVVTQLYCFHSGKWSLLEIVRTPGLTIVF